MFGKGGYCLQVGDRPRGYTFGEIGGARAKFVEKTGLPIEWGNDDDDDQPGSGVKAGQALDEKRKQERAEEHARAATEHLETNSDDSESEDTDSDEIGPDEQPAPPPVDAWPEMPSDPSEIDHTPHILH